MELDENENSVNLPKPFNVNLHRVREGHFQCDFQYLARPVEKTEATHSHEHSGQQWFTEEEVKEIDVPEDVREIMLQALRLGKDEYSL